MSGETVGEYLKKERELRQISLQEVAEETKISVSRLKALEANQFDQLPAPIYIRGFVRIYAEYIGLDPSDVMMRFEDQLFYEESEPKTAGFKTLEEERALARRRMITVVASIIGAIILIAIGLYFYFDQQNQQNRAMEGLTLPETSLGTDLALPGGTDGLAGPGSEEGAGQDGLGAGIGQLQPGQGKESDRAPSGLGSDAAPPAGTLPAEGSPSGEQPRQP